MNGNDGILLDPSHGLTVLARAANRAPHPGSPARQQLASVLTGRLERLLETAISVGREAGGVIGEVLSEVLKDGGDPLLARRALEVIPEDTTALQPVQLVANRMVLAAFPPLSEEPPDEVRLEIGRFAFNGAAAALAQGKGPAAIELLGLSIQAFQPLVSGRPGLWLVLGKCISAASSAFKQLDEPEKMLEAAANGVDLIEIARKEYPDDEYVAAELAQALVRRSQASASLGREGEALDAALSAVRLLARLYRAVPEAHGPELCRALTALSIRQAHAGRDSAALRTSKRALRLARQLAAMDWDGFAEEQADALNSFALRSLHGGLICEARRAVEEALVFTREMYRMAPLGARFPLADTLHTHALVLFSDDDPEGAIVAAEEAVALFDALPQRLNVSDRAMAWSTLGQMLVAKGRMSQGVAALEQARDLYLKANALCDGAYGEQLARVESSLRLATAEEVELRG